MQKLDKDMERVSFQRRLSLVGKIFPLGQHEALQGVVVKVAIFVFVPDK